MYGNGVEDSGVLTLTDKSSTDEGNDTKFTRPHVEEWVRQTSQSALPLESVTTSHNEIPPREIMTSPTPTENSLNYSQLVSSVYRQYHMIVH